MPTLLIVFSIIRKHFLLTPEKNGIKEIVTCVTPNQSVVV